MTYIIDPMIFYYIGLADKIGAMLGFLAVLFFLIVSLQAILILKGLDDNDMQTGAPILDEDEKPTSRYHVAHMKNYKRYLKAMKRVKILLATTLLCILLQPFIPSKETMVQMTVASVVTKENIEYTTDGIKDMIDYIFEKIKGE